VKAKPWSSPKTTERALALLEDLDWSQARVADVGAGRGWFSRVLSERLRETKGLDPKEHVFPCDAAPDSFEVDELDCVPLGPGGRLPFEDASFDAAVSLEVIEHVEDQLGFLKEIARIVKPGGLVIVSTPNVLSLTSRIRTLLWGFPELYDPLPLEGGDPRVLSGHIHPIAPYFLAHAALRAGLVDPHLHSDRTKRSSALYAVLLSPALFVAQLSHRSRMARKHPDVFEANRRLIAEQSGWKMLTSRTTILSAHTRSSGNGARR
jgi:2-polyprenyl-3-methyl-5-hydroxy-6-metoxy-1,4-benzoquinol methylase